LSVLLVSRVLATVVAGKEGGGEAFPGESSHRNFRNRRLDGRLVGEALPEESFCLLPYCHIWTYNPRVYSLEESFRLLVGDPLGEETCMHE